MCKAVAHTVKMKEAPSLANSIPNARDKYSESKIQRFCVSVTSEIYKAPRQAKPSPRRAEYIGCGHGDESQVVGVSSFLYRTIKDLLPGNDFLLRDSKIINTRVISLSLFPPPPGELDPPVRVELAHENASFVDPECVSWDFGIQLPNRTTKGGWSTEGCAVLLSNDSHTVCQCKHLTDFAVLVTPFVPKMDAPSANEISFIVAIGCGIAMLEIASVILVYILLWRCIRCDRSVIVLNLSLSLLNANGVFLGGIPQKWNKTICTAVAAMLHYFFLAAFCWMLAEGWHMYSSLVRTNGKLSKAKLYIALGWRLFD
ncbi:hypothetical protein Bbelb_400410 [Branchiostoma belcheri]|nr:hypothetical protein Bbelb_400410 [Branchiostoma belcheri]